MKRETKRRIACFLGSEFLLVLLVTLPLFLTGAQPASLPVMAAGAAFMWCPALATLLTKRITGDKSALALKPRLQGNGKAYLLAAFVPGALALGGAALYFVIFPGQLDLAMGYVKELLAASGQAVQLPQLNVGSVLGAGVLLAAAAPLVLVNHLLAFGEEVGWRGYLLPLLCEAWGARKATVWTGVLWGAAHAPLVCFGVNYAGDYPGAPWSGMLLMVLFAASVGTFLSYLTLRTESVLPACIAHGALNAVREAPLFVCVPAYNALLGPKASGLVGMAGFLILALALLWGPLRGRKDRQKI